MLEQGTLTDEPRRKGRDAGTGTRRMTCDIGTLAHDFIDKPNVRVQKIQTTIKPVKREQRREPRSKYKTTRSKLITNYFVIKFEYLYST